MPPPEPTPSPVPTAPPFHLQNQGTHVESVTFTAHPVHRLGAEELHSLHIGEAIRYTNGHVDVVGYFPEGKGIGNDGDPFYAEQNIGPQTPAQYVAEAKNTTHWRFMRSPVRRSISSSGVRPRLGTASITP